jgi:hypothetical protein
MLLQMTSGFLQLESTIGTMNIAPGSSDQL